MSLKVWILTVAVSGLTLTVLSLLLPQGKMGKFIKNMFPFIMTFCIIRPILDGNISLDVLNFNLNEIQCQEEFLTYVNDGKIFKLKENCLNFLEEQGVLGCDIDIDYTVKEDFSFTINKVKINLKNSVIKSDKEHIDIIEQVKSGISKILDINEGIIFIDE